MAKTKECEVCGAQASCIGSTKHICKSCSTFYRRTYSQYGTLKCRRSENCQIRETERTLCRACRLQKCRDVGLRMAGKNLIVQFNGQPENDSTDDNINLSESQIQMTTNEERINGCFAECSTSQSNNSSPQNYYTFPTNQIQPHLSLAEQCQLQSKQMLKAFPDNNRYPMLSKVVEAFQQFERRQRFLSAMHQDKEIVENELTKIVHIVQAKMESSTNRLACMFIMELLSSCDLTREQRISILKVASIKVAMAHKFSLNAPRFFPDLGDTRVCTYLGLFYDVNDLGAFFQGIKLVDKKVIDIIRPICEAGLKATEKARILKPTIIEFGGLSS